MTLKETFQKAVAKQIGGNKQHGWGSEDSLAVIVALIADNAGCDIADIAGDAEFTGALKQVINPSQFRQKLESAKILDVAPTKREKVNNLLADFTA